MIDPTIPPYQLVAALFDAGAVILDHADRAPESIAALPEPVRAWIAATQPAMHSMLATKVQRELFPDAPRPRRGAGA